MKINFKPIKLGYFQKFVVNLFKLKSENDGSTKKTESIKSNDLEHNSIKININKINNTIVNSINKPNQSNPKKKSFEFVNFM